MVIINTKVWVYIDKITQWILRVPNSWQNNGIKINIEPCTRPRSKTDKLGKHVK